MKVKDIFYLSGTHWDREWYQTFQGFRNRLVSTIDDMIDYLEKEDKFGVFHLDGQTIVLEDYEEIAPDNKDRLKKLINDGRIKIGPWYDMPDEFLLSGESLIRNLMKGTRIAEKWGVEPWQVGYICDIFGHIAQMPQIFAGFGLNHSVLGRGMRDDAKTFFKWQSPDGTECITFNLNPEEGYGCLGNMIINRCKNPDDYEQLKATIKEGVDEEIKRSNSSVLILMDAQDHMPLNEKTPLYLDIIRELYPDINVHHCDVAEAQEIIESEADNYPTIAGELNTTSENKHSYIHLITNTLSSYYTHKKSNDECQNLLEKVLEPMVLFSGLCDKKIRRSYIDLAYKYLLQNHPHDSICGCSIDQVHKDMVYRFDQVKEIGEILTENFLYENRPEAGEDSTYVLKLYNALPFARTECVTADIILKADFPTKYSEPFDYENIFSFKLLDDKGNEIPYQVVSMTKNYFKHVYKLKSENGEGYKISFMADMPACGYKEYKLVPSARPSRYLEKMLSGADFAENDFVRVSITQNGEINIFDKKTGAEYKNLASLTDDGEIGDGWYHANPVNDVTVYSASTGARVEKIENGPSRCVFRVTKIMEVPACVENKASGYERSSEYVKMPVSFEVGLSKNARFADVKLTVNNTAKDHRLKLNIPTGIDNKKYFAGQAFYCNERKTGIDYSTQDWREHDQYEKQMNGILGKRDEKGNGIAFISANGLHECAGLDNGNLDITLLRAFRRTVGTMGEVNGQMQGEMVYNFYLAPIDDSVTYSDLVKMQDTLAVKPEYSCSEVKADYTLTEKSFMEISGDNINLSVVKMPEETEENTLIVRVFNASGADAKGKITFFKDIKNAYVTNINEKVQSEIKANGNTLDISLTPWKIGTYKIKF